MFQATHKITWYGGHSELCRVIEDRTSPVQGIQQLTGSMLIETSEGQRWISFGLWNAVKIESALGTAPEPVAEQGDPRPWARLNAPREMVLIRWNGQSRPVYVYRDELNLPSWMRTEVVR